MQLRFEHNQPTEQIIATLREIPPTVTHLDLRDNLLGQRTAKELQAIFRAIPEFITRVDLGDNMLGLKTADELDLLFRDGIPPTVTSLILSGNLLGQKTCTELRVVFDAIPPTLKHLDLSGNGFNKHKSTEELTQIFRALPRSLYSLVLGCHKLGEIPTADLLKILTGLPRNLESLDLGYHLLMHKNAGECIHKNTMECILILQALPPNLTALNLSGNGLGVRRKEDLLEIFKRLPPHLTDLDLSGNALGFKSADELAEIFRMEVFKKLRWLNVANNDLFIKNPVECQQTLGAFPRQLESLKLQGNWFSLGFKYSFDSIFGKLPPGLAHLNLSGMGLGLLKPEKLVEILQSMPPELTSLDLGFNELFKRGMAERDMAVLNAIPKGLKSIDLSGNGYLQIPEILSAIPQSLTSFCMSIEDFVECTLHELLVAFKKLPATITIRESNYTTTPSNFLLDLIITGPKIQTLLDGYETPTAQGAAAAQVQPKTQSALRTFRPRFAINQANLFELIEFLEAHPSPRANIICALLLENRIHNTPLARNEAYWNQRRCLAIDFFQRACFIADEHLSKKIEDMMRHRKLFTAEKHLVCQKLSGFDRRTLPEIDLNKIRALLVQTPDFQHSLSAAGVFGNSKRKTSSYPERKRLISHI